MAKSNTTAPPSNSHLRGIVCFTLHLHTSLVDIACCICVRYISVVVRSIGFLFSFSFSFRNKCVTIMIRPAAAAERRALARWPLCCQVSIDLIAFQNIIIQRERSKETVLDLWFGFESFQYCAVEMLKVTKEPGNRKGSGSGGVNHLFPPSCNSNHSVIHLEREENRNH